MGASPSDSTASLDLDRQFAPYRPGTESGVVAVSWGLGRHSGTLSWIDLLDKPCVVVLGEAGTGKTTELKRQAEHLRASEKPAFFGVLLRSSLQPIR